MQLCLRICITRSMQKKICTARLMMFKCNRFSVHPTQPTARDGHTNRVSSVLSIVFMFTYSMANGTCADAQYYVPCMLYSHETRLAALIHGPHVRTTLPSNGRIILCIMVRRSLSSSQLLVVSLSPPSRRAVCQQFPVSI